MACAAALPSVQLCHCLPSVADPAYPILRPGDRLLSVDGVPAGTDITAVREELLRWVAGEPALPMDEPEDQEYVEAVATLESAEPVNDFEEEMVPFMEPVAVAEVIPVAKLISVSLRGGKNIAQVSAHLTAADLEFLSNLIEAGKVQPQIDRRYPFAEIPAAIAYLEQGHARGKVVVGAP